MPRSSPELKEKIIKQMLPLQHISVQELSKKNNIPVPTLYQWKKDAKANGSVIQNHSSKNEKYSNEVKLNIIIETAHLNQQELSEYCRVKVFISTKSIHGRQCSSLVKQPLTLK